MLSVKHELLAALAEPYCLAVEQASGGVHLYFGDAIHHGEVAVHA